MKIGSYLGKETLHQGKKYLVYRAKKTGETTSYILKVLEKKAAYNVKAEQGLRNEYQLIEQIDSQHVVKVADRMENKDYAVLVLEDINGVSLGEHLKAGAYPVDRFMESALMITSGLTAIHRENIIHKDINCSNIIRNPKTGALQIIDFDIASKFDVTLSYLGNPEHLQGTLSYISPEQTGRMNRRVDQRTDLYSLGVTFYEMLTGQLPFRQSDPMEIVYAHLARDPEPPHAVNERIPRILSEIILKLLAKNPEDRYQSAEGLKHDLEKARELNMADFRLGEKDFSGKLQIPEKLYGRENEVRQLLAAYDEAAKGPRKMILVAGYSGTGKTALVHEVHKPITENRGFFVSGKFDQLQRTIPYFAFIQALNQFCRLLLTEKQEILDQWKDRILLAVGKLGKVLTDIIPQLEAVIGEQPDVPEVGGEDARKRFNYVLQSFLEAVSTAEHPLVIFIDDLQWADLASMNLLKILMVEKQLHHLLLIGAYRDNEVTAAHPLMTVLEEIRKEEGKIETIAVKNLSPEHVGAWLNDTLKTAAGKETAGLAGLIYEKTQGNAFFTVRFLENLYNEGLLRFDFKKSKWRYDIGEIEKQNITDNVVDLLVRKIRMFPAGAQDVLKLASSIGNTFTLDTLSVISQTKKEEHAKHLEIALTEHLVYPLEHEVYKFVHDRIHQAAYTLIAEDEKKDLHLKIGRLLLKTSGLSDMAKLSEEWQQHFFDIANHLNIGIDLVTGEEEKIQLLQLNLEAGKNAKISGAYKHGADYVQKAVTLLPPDSWQSRYDLSLAVYNEAVQLAYLNADFEEMEKFAGLLLSSVHNLLDKRVAFEHRMMSFVARNQPQAAVETLLDAFGKLGVDIPIKPGGEESETTFTTIHTLWEEKGEQGLMEIPHMEDPQKQLVMKLFTIGLTGILYYSQELFPFVTGKMVELSLKFGLTPETPFVFSLYGTIKNFMGDIAGAYQVGKISTELLAKIPDSDIYKPKPVYISCAYMLAWKEHYKDVAKRLTENYQIALNVGDIEYGCYSLTNVGMYLSRCGGELTDLKRSLSATRETTVAFKQEISSMVPYIEGVAAANLLGETPEPSVMELDYDILPKSMEGGIDQTIMYMISIRKVFFAYLFDEYNHIIEYIKEAEDSWAQLTMPLIFFKVDYYFQLPLVYLELYSRTASAKEKKKYLQRVKEGMKLMEEWSKFGPVNYLHKYYLMQAELYRVTGKTKKAEEFYEKAAETAYENDYINEAALANELAGKFYKQDNRHKLAALYFIEARNCYHKWGAAAKVKDLETKYPRYLSLGFLGSTLSTRTISTTSTDSTGDFLDVKSIIKASQTLSGEVQLKGLLEKMMQILIENAGAQKSLLMENADGRLLIQAEGNTDGVSGSLQEQPVAESGKVPLSVINYVAHSRQQLVFDNVSKDPNYSTDRYIQKNQPKSVVCVPIMSKGELSAVIYLENNLVEGAFTPARLEILNMLSSQIAISVENTHLYEQLEEKVRQRTIALQKANEELEENHKALEESHKKINDSVNYASRIQEAVLPAPEIIETIFPRHFILYRPCSVVSGDFYWVKQVAGKTVAAAADCTGHGVPGALVSMLGAAFLNEIVPLLAAKSLLSAGNVLNELRGNVKTALKQRGLPSEQKEGMDIALCVIDHINQKIQYAGAYNPLYIVRDNQLTEVKGDRMPIGIYRNERPFTNHELPLESGSMLYLCTDGYADQNREEIRGAFTKRRFKQLLIEINQEPPDKQKEILIDRLEAWKGDLPQRDDILVFGIRL
ncbi:MAG: AAA family ATPase [bacterium]|nr:AAA family ATPase [bacterium]